MNNWINHTVTVALGAVFLAGSVQAQPRGDERHDGGHNNRAAASACPMTTATTSTWWTTGALTA